MEKLFTDIITYFEAYSARIFLACSVIVLFEYIFPMSRYSFVSRLRGGLFWLVYIVINAVAFSLFWRVWAYLHITPLIHVDLRSLSSYSQPLLKTFGGVAAALILIQFGEFFYYWFHRLQHRNSTLWKFHAVHHSLEEMSAFNSNHHFTEELFRIPFIVLPMSLLFSFQQGYVPWIWAALMGWQGIYEHSCTKLHLGWFRYIVPDNRFHRIHHSKDDEHKNKNFGSASALWDFVFRTIHFTKRNEWPEVGLVDQSEPKNVNEFLWRPFK